LDCPIYVSPIYILFIYLSIFISQYTHANVIGKYEDPMLWRSSRGFHLLTHDKLGQYPAWYNDHGGYWYSADGHDWHGPVESAYNTTVEWKGGAAATNTTLSSRQRPFLFFSERNSSSGGGGGGGGSSSASGAPPFYLYNGVGLPGKSHWDFSFTFVQEAAV
jgi:hypothetical protein